MIRFGLAILLLAFAGPGQAQQGRDEAKKLEQLRDAATAKQQSLEQQANQTRSRITSLQNQLIELGGRIAQQNLRSVATEENLLILQMDAAGQMKQLLADKKALGEVLAALQRSQMSPPPPLAVNPDDTLAAARATLLLGETVPALRERAQSLRVSLEKLTQLRQQIESSKLQLQTQMRIFTEEQESLEGLLGQRQQLESQLRGSAQIASNEAQSLATRAANVRELIRQLEAEAAKTMPSLKPTGSTVKPVLSPGLKPDAQQTDTPQPAWRSPTGRFSDSRGQLDMPVAGVLLAGYGQDEHPDRQSGMVMATSRRAQIISPYDARIAYSGKFRNYGQLLILDVGGGYHIILSGLAVSYVVKGQEVLAGEPIGKMADRRKPAPEFYLEFRKQGKPFDPEPWLKKAIKAG
ncbi:hypothetical protein MNBD_ALPHA06-1679 [hydrothermal vent metagenome]|uniref:M23ase beta-sheet core domain-containing protein n=1 Tax=hydrothermal vent metagenome TaxID=652676 RepID=A0A3B0R4W0_9ZZZZ